MIYLLIGFCLLALAMVGRAGWLSFRPGVGLKSIGQERRGEICVSVRPDKHRGAGVSCLRLSVPKDKTVNPFAANIPNRLVSPFQDLPKPAVSAARRENFQKNANTDQTARRPHSNVSEFTVFRMVSTQCGKVVPSVLLILRSSDQRRLANLALAASVAVTSAESTFSPLLLVNRQVRRI